MPTLTSLYTNTFLYTGHEPLLQKLGNVLYELEAAGERYRRIRALPYIGELTLLAGPIRFNTGLVLLD